MDAVEYIQPRIKALLDHSNDIYEYAPGPTNEFDTWSALKLILHSTGVSTYTKVHNRQGTGDIFYIDALAGSGLSEYDGGYFLGSALLALRATHTPFSKMYFIENDHKNATALRNRLKYAFDLPDFSKPDDWGVFECDANEKIPEIVQEIRSIGDYEKGFNYYAFIDNQATDIEWKTIEELTPTPYGDLLINIPLAHTIGRNINKNTTDDLNRFYGEDLSAVHYTQNVRDQCRERYLNNLAARDRPMQVVTEVHGGTGSFRYDLAYATRETRNQNPWLDAIRYTRDFVEKFHGGDVQRILEVIQGPQDNLQQYIPREEIESDALHDSTTSEEAEDDAQANFTDFQQSS